MADPLPRIHTSTWYVPVPNPLVSQMKLDPPQSCTMLHDPPGGATHHRYCAAEVPQLALAVNVTRLPTACGDPTLELMLPFVHCRLYGMIA